MKTAILVDDEPLMGGVLRTMLELLGVQATACSSMEQARERIAAGLDGIDMVFLDGDIRGVNNPQDGEVLFREIKEISPDLLCIRTSGNPRGDWGDRTLQKPFSVQQLKEVIS